MKTEKQSPGFEYVGFWLRLIATIIDVIIITAIILPLLLAIYGKSYFDPGELIKGPSDFLISYVLPAVAVIILWRYKAATPGKMLISARIVDAKTFDRPVTGRLIIRYFAYILSAIPFCIGFIWIAFDKKKQSWHDKLAGTVVVRPKK
ncbi:MAG: RDD family protein [Desulfobacteraceae bacterium]|nr:MAG: RDD family protein [Desulfobacteraceae bacterium]